MAFWCRYGGQCNGCGECRSRHGNQAEKECLCPVCGYECTRLFVNIYTIVLGCENCVSEEDAAVILENRSFKDV